MGESVSVWMRQAPFVLRDYADAKATLKVHA